MSKLTSYTAKVPDQDGRITYTASENEVWRDLYLQQKQKVDQYCANEYLSGLAKMDLPTDKIPQCPDLSAVLQDLTGWSVKPVPALIGFGLFFEMLANKTFPAASFIRSRKDFNYIEEPDIFHEVFGHTPLLTDPRFAKFSEAIGKAGLICQKEDYSWLIRLYWFTIEFGLIHSPEGTKALGSGLASSPTELVHSIFEETVFRKPFDIVDVLRTPYRIDIHQPIYFVLETPDQLFEIYQRDLLADIRMARNKGLHAPLFSHNK